MQNVTRSKPNFCYWCFHVAEPRRKKKFMFEMYVTFSKHRNLKISVSLDDLSFIH